MNKKAIAILAAIFLLIVGTLGFLIYSRSSSTKEETPTSSENSGGETSENGSGTAPAPTPTPPPPTEKFVLLTASSEAGVVSPILFYNGNGVTYVNSQGQLIKADFETLADGRLSLTRARNLDIPQKSGIDRILWPKNGDDFIAEFESASTGLKSYSYFNFSTGSFVDLPEQVRSLEWMPSGDKILFIWADKDEQGQEKTTLNLANPDSTEYKQIAELYEDDDAIYLSPDGLNLVFHRTNNQASVNKIVLTTPDGKVWRDLVADGYNYGVLWSPDSQKFLFSKRERSGRNYQLWYYDLYVGEVKNLGLYTLPSKVVWGADSRTIYAAVPQNDQGISDPASLKNTFTSDAFYKIDTTSLEKTEYLSQNSTIDGRELFLNPSEDKLFFKNAQDGGLYYLDLTQ